MIREISIQNYKSIQNLELELGRVNVFIGENGAGKSNLLEAIAIASAASAGKLDNEFLASRGVRVTQPELMRSGFKKRSISRPIEIIVKGESGSRVRFVINNDNTLYSKWTVVPSFRPSGSKLRSAVSQQYISNYVKNNVELHEKDSFIEDMRSFGKVMQDVLSAKNDIDARADKISSAKDANTTRKNDDKLISSADFSYTPTSDKFKEFLHNLLYVRMIDDEIAMPNDTLGRFVIFSPEHSQLRQFDQEGQIEPLGIIGQGLLKLLQFMSEESADTLTPITKGLRLLGWFKDFAVVFDKLHGRLEISDRFLAPGLKYADQRSANEGFLFLLFYFTLFSSDLTPNFFGVDNLDTSLNPKLCQRLLIELVELSKDHDKQTLITTHNPAILDGLNLDDDAQRLFVLYRGDHGQSMVRRIKKPETTGAPIRLSEAFLRGALGGLPKSF